MSAHATWAPSAALALALSTLACGGAAPAPAAIGPGSGAAQRAAEHGPTGPAYARVRIDGVPHVRQRPDFCGEACAEMALRRLGQPLGQDDVFNLSGVDPALGRGLVTPELKIALERIGFSPGQTWYRIDAAQAAAGLEAQFAALHADLTAGIPSIVCMHYDDQPDSTEHFRLIVGYEPARDEVVYHEPAEDNGAYRTMPRALFQRLWPLKYNPDRWTVVRLRLEPGAALAAPIRPPTTRVPSPADYAQRVHTMKKRAGQGFAAALEPPFVVIGDGGHEAVRSVAAHTVRWAARRLGEAYFDKAPPGILEIWLFKDRESYLRNAFFLWGHRPETPFGYYSSEDKALVMNIATGTGTLVHEMVHPFIEAHFPGCPPWFNEGLASLYEQSGEERGRIHGYTNWRLPGLKKAIRAGKLPSFRELTSYSAREFYAEDRGTNYGQSRYLCYYLQEAGLLGRLYQEMRAGNARDPTGYAALQRVLSEPDMDAFQQRWEAFVLGLSYP